MHHGSHFKLELCYLYPSRCSMGRLFRLNIGFQVIGAYTNLILYTLEAVQVYHYFRRSRRAKNDKKILKCVIVLAMILDTLCTIAVCGLVFMYTVIFWGKLDAVAMSREYWPFVVVTVLTGTTTFMVQSFMLHRYWRIAPRRVTHVIAAMIITLMVASLVATYVTAALSLSERARDRVKRIPYIVLCLGGAAVIDVWLTTLLIWQLHKMRTDFQATTSLLRRISATAIRTGLFTAIVACATVITFVAFPRSLLSDAVLFNVGRVYTCSMMFTLNTRGAISRDTRAEYGAHESSEMSGAKLRSQPAQDQSTATATEAQT